MILMPKFAKIVGVALAKTAILFRLGGLGDVIILTVVARELQKRGYEVDGCFGSPTCDTKKLLENTKLFRTIYQSGRIFTGLDVYEGEDKDAFSIEFLKNHYDLVVDYKLSVELNSHYRHIQGQTKEWFQSQSSNYVNWMDIMLGWAGIDPATVEDKSPVYIIEPQEREWADKIIGREKGTIVFTVQLNASSLVRTWYHPQHLPGAIKDAFQMPTKVIIFDGATWHMVKGKSSFPIQIPKEFDPIRASAALVGSSDMFVGADSGFSHIAEALKVKSLTVYTTVPAWTRMKYYKYSYAIEPEGDVFDGVHC